MSIQLQFLGTEAKTCEPMLIGWSGINDTPVDALFRLFLMRTDTGSEGRNDSASDRVLLGEAKLGDTSFRWPQVIVGPGTFVVNATGVTSSSKSLTFAPTSPFEVVAGDTSCVTIFAEGLSTSTTATETGPSSTPGPAPTSSPNLAIIVGAAAGGVAIILLVILIWLLWRRRRRSPVAVQRSQATGLAQPGLEKPHHYSLTRASHHSLPRASDAVPMIPLAPGSPLSPRFDRQSGVYPRRPSVDTYLRRSSEASQRPLQVQLLPAEAAVPPIPYAESTAASDDSFAEERDALREEFLVSEGATSMSGGHKKGERSFSAVGSSVASDMGVGLDRDRRTPNRGRQKPVTFAVSNPDNTVWEDEQQRPGARRQASK